MDQDSRHILILIMVTTLVRLLFSGSVYLVDDETYYWVWSRFPDWSYFDHPPLIAWFIRLSTELFGASPLGLRTLGVLSGAVATWVGLDLTYRIFPDKKVLWHAAGLYLLSIPFFGAAVIMTPDTPLVLCLSLGLWCFYRAAYEGLQNAWWGCGVCFGLALLSKYTALLWLVALFLLLATDPQQRWQLRQPRPWLAGFLALALFTPVLVWNAGHDWASFRFQISHGWGGDGRTLRHLGEFLAGQAGLLTPGVFVLLLVVWLRLLPRWSTLPGRERFLLYTSLLPFLVFVLAGLRTRVEANWPGFVYFSGYILVARWHSRAGIWRRLARGNLLLMGLFLAVILIQVWSGFLPLSGKTDPTRRFYGWPEALDRVAEIWRAHPEALPVGNKYQQQSQLAYRFGMPRVPALNIRSRPNHFDYVDDHHLIGRNLLIVSNEKQPDPGKFAGHFRRVTHLETVWGRRRARPARRLQVYYGEEYSGRRPGIAGRNHREAPGGLD